ncbi:ABC transporter ATP-binding protein [Spongiactinospora rosea]|uniref:ABC transporter ATP-binding protein n=1 Tax=Spongiactinospora rosea TaxID=2248750 RepID=A0A366M3H9_9ACTN|nr:ATP-binding cassette domain-containing protein [Spongiactinospora rosea]RBQ20144.1 ABC transporter ATP-binding protein [Spongiactinospora rosea]
MDAVQISELSHRYGRTVALNGISVTVPRGVTALLGPNGAGKSTLLNLLSTAYPIQDGEVVVHGFRMTATPRLLSWQAARKTARLRRRIGLLPQNFTFHPRFTVAETLEYAAWLRKYRRPDLRARIHEVLELVDLAGTGARRLRELSGGMLRRVGIAQAIVHEPDLILLDEPANGLDPEQRVRLRQVIKALPDTMTVLVSTHLVEDVAALAARAVVLKDGRVIFTGEVPELVALAGEPGGVTTSDVERAYLALMSKADRSMMPLDER